MSRNYEHKDYSILRLDNETMRDRIKELSGEIKLLKDEIEKLKNERENIFIEKWELGDGEKLQK
jgi:predicted RNase H-like nuclease (RuvC/YqgF family)